MAQRALSLHVALALFFCLRKIAATWQSFFDGAEIKVSNRIAADPVPRFGEFQHRGEASQVTTNSGSG